MSTIKAIRLQAYGGPETLKLDEIEAPTPGPGQVLVKVEAASVNPLDWKIRQGFMQSFMPLDLPAVLGCDLAGTVEALGEGVDGFKVGDAVYALRGRSGAYAQKAVVDVAKLALKPASASFTQAAAMPVAALTAWQALFDLGELKAGERVLIHAGAGGVGGFAIQFAHNQGAYVITTASAANEAYVRGLGADEVIDHRATAFETAVSDIDLVIDLIGGDTQERSWGVLKPGGRMVSAAGAPDPARAAAIGGVGRRITVEDRGDQLAQIAQLYDDGKVTVTIAQTYPLAEAAAAQESVKGGRTRGKIVLTVA